MHDHQLSMRILRRHETAVLTATSRAALAQQLASSSPSADMERRTPQIVCGTDQHAHHRMVTLSRDFGLRSRCRGAGADVAPPPPSARSARAAAVYCTSHAPGKLRGPCC